MTFGGVNGLTIPALRAAWRHKIQAEPRFSAIRAATKQNCNYLVDPNQSRPYMASTDAALPVFELALLATVANIIG